jgi:chromatin segregation and condensation protein Rec8/ScpA/Scc1 (kleisin family)
MKMIIQKRLGVRTSMTKIRRLMRITGAWNALKASLQSAKQLLNESFKSYKEAKLLAPEWREDHLDALDKAKAEKNKSTQEKERKQWKEIERQRELSRKIKKLRTKTKNSVTKLFSRQKTAPVLNVSPKIQWRKHVSRKMNGALANLRIRHPCQQKSSNKLACLQKKMVPNIFWTALSRYRRNAILTLGS